MVVKPKSKWYEKSYVFSYKDLQSMHYLHASICESMRLYQPVLLDSKHVLHNDILLNGIIMHRGPRDTYHPYDMGRMNAIWSIDCLEFKPERWLNKDGHFIP